MKYGYARVSTEDQNLDRQLDILQKYGIDKLFNEKITGTKKSRPELDKMLLEVKKGDSIIVESLSRLGRSTKNLIELMETFNNKGINLVSLKESIDTSTATGKLMFTMVSAFAQFERDIIAERTKEGLKAARARGRLGGRPTKHKKDIARAIKLYNSKAYSIKEIEEMTSVSKATLYRYLKSREESDC